jgi:hypothetical protein
MGSATGMHRCKKWLDQSNVAAIGVAPNVRDRVAIAQLVIGGEQEQSGPEAVRDMQSTRGLHHGTNAVLVRRHRQHPEYLPSEVPFVLPDGVRLISEQIVTTHPSAAV